MMSQSSASSDYQNEGVDWDLYLRKRRAYLRQLRLEAQLVTQRADRVEWEIACIEAARPTLD